MRALVYPWRHLNSWLELREKRWLFIGIIRTWNLNLITGTNWNLRERNDELTTIYSQQNQILVSERKEASFWETSICQGDLVPLPILTVTRRWVSATGSARDFTLCASWPGTVPRMLAEDTSLPAQRGLYCSQHSRQHEFHAYLCPPWPPSPTRVMQHILGLCPSGSIPRLGAPSLLWSVANDLPPAPEGDIIPITNNSEWTCPLQIRGRKTLHLPRLFALLPTWGRSLSQKLSVRLLTRDPWTVISWLWAIFFQLLQICKLKAGGGIQPAQGHQA